MAVRINLGAVVSIDLFTFPRGTKWAKIKPSVASQISQVGGLTDGETGVDPIFEGTKIDILAGEWEDISVGGQGAHDATPLPSLNGLPYFYLKPSAAFAYVEILFG